jgi:hypothetical protein
MGAFGALAKQLNKKISSNAIEDSPGKMKKSMFSTEGGGNRLELALNNAFR